MMHGPKQASVSLQTLRFAVVGTVTAGIYFLGYNALRGQLPLSPALASGIAYVAAIVFQYMGHATFTFRKRVLDAPQVIRFLVTNGAGLVFSTFGAFLLVSVLMMSDWIASALIVVALPIINWVVMRRWVFS